MGGGEAKTTENMEYLYVYVRSWGTEEEEDTHFTYWKVVDECRDHVEIKSLSANFSA